jgi:thiazole synthase
MNENENEPGDEASNETVTDLPVGDNRLTVGGKTLASRLIVGTGRYDTMRQMRASIDASGADCVTVAVRRERLYDRTGQNILDFLDLERCILLPNTAGCYNAVDAVRAARLGREILKTLQNPGSDWVKLEVLGDSKTLLPDPVETLEACKQLVAEGFKVLCYTSDDPVIARRLKDLGAASVMPAGSPIGSGQGLLNPNNLQIILEYLKAGDPDYPVIVDAGVGTASDVSQAFELGADGVLLNTAIAHARDPIRMGRAMRHAAIAGRDAFLAGRIPRRLYATASSPEEGVISSRPYGHTDKQPPS